MMIENSQPPNESPEASPSSNVSTTVSDSLAEFIPGQLTAFDSSEQPFAEISDDEEKILNELVIIASRTDVASRRFEVEQAWEARLFERGYQHLLPRRGGGWSLPGEGSKWGPLSTADSSALYSTNIYGRDKDIIVAAIARETPQIQFFPQDPSKVIDMLTAEQANKYKAIYVKNNELRQRLAELAYYYYTDDRAILYTRYVVDAQRFGTNEDGSPCGREITSVFGKLEGKVPMQATCQKEMHFIQLYNEIDVATAKARYPWAAKNIRPGSCGIGEIELDKIARVNTKLALLGSYVTGDALMREVTEQYTWLRPEAFYDECVSDEIRASFLEKFPKGCLIVYAGQTFCFARAESMDDKLVITHAMPGIGQNRRALGTNNISVQKRLNAYFDIMDDFFRKTVPRRHYDSEAFDVTALQRQDNTPGGSGPFLRQPGVTVDQLVFVEPTPQPQPSLPEFTKMFFDEMPASLSGAVPALFGGSTNTDTVGGIAMQRDQALARIGMPWNQAKQAFSEACRQAVMAAALRPDPISESLPNGNVEIDPQLLRGNIVCYPEYDQSFPETWKERELRYTEIVMQAPQNPFYAALLKVPGNLRAIAENIRMADLELPGEASVKKALIAIDILKMSQALPNPEFLQREQQIEQVKLGMQQSAQRGEVIPPEAQQMLAQAAQALNQMPQEVPSVQVAPDASENHEIEAETAFYWLNSEEGIKFKSGDANQQAGFHNVFLFWQDHEEMAKKLAPPPVAPMPHVSIPYDKIPPEAQTQALAHAGIQTTPADTQQKQLTDTQHEIAKKIVPKTVPASENIQVSRIKRSAGPKGGTANGGGLNNAG
jgi:hypothetical protein